jgi:hypothetical protein
LTFDLGFVISQKDTLSPRKHIMLEAGI